MKKLKKYGKQYLPVYYFEGEYLRIAQSIYNGEAYLLGNLSKDSINKISPKGMSLFLYAIYTDNEEAMNILLKKGGDANTFTKVESFSSDSWLEQTPLSMASQRPKISYITTLLSCGANINDNRATPALLNAIKRNDREMVNYLLDHGADINIQQVITKKNALLQAANILDYDMVNYLLDRGADPMLRNVTGDCLAYTVQFEIQTQVEKGRGTEKFKKTMYDLKKRLESMGVVFPVQKIPPPKDEKTAISKVEPPSPEVPFRPSTGYSAKTPPTKPPHSWILDDDDDNLIIS